MFSGLNLFFTLIMLAIFALSTFQIINNNTQNTFVKQSPTLLTSIGIFGTFFGIVIALLGFEGVDNIKEQIDVIISGMQTAFITSVLGLFLSLILKFIMIFKKDDDIDDISGENLIQAFIMQTNNSNEILEKMGLLLNAVGRDGENSMIGQIKLLRSDFNDRQKQHMDLFHHLEQKINQQLEVSNKSFQVLLKSYQDKKIFEEKLWQAMDKVTQTLAKSATEAIIQALKDVITDFNNNLTEQFGENFKELNHAVFKLVQWQENYKQQIADMTEQYQLGIQAIDNTKISVESIERQARSIPELIGQLGIVIDDNHNKLDELTNHLQAFADIRKHAIQSLPEIQSHITLVLDNMKNGSQSVKDVMISTANDFNNHTKQSLTKISSLSDTILVRTQEIDKKLVDIATNIEQSLRTWTHGFEKSLEDLIKDLQKSLQHMSSEQKEFVKAQLKDLAVNIQKSYQETQDDINKILKDTQENMGKTQEKAISDMGKSLVSITGQFATDYTRLTNEMNRVISQNGGFR